MQNKDFETLKELERPIVPGAANYKLDDYL
jgi:hypothetical protein